MFKKVLVMLLAAIMLIGCVACDPAEPAEPTPEPTPELTGDPLIDNLIFHADFSKESAEDATGNSKITTEIAGEEGGITYVTDEEIERTVAQFQNAYVSYDVDLENLGRTFTMEAYVRSERQSGLGLICGTYSHSQLAGVGFGTGMFPDAAKPFGTPTGLSIFAGTLRSVRTVNSGYFRTWNHLVFVHDGSAGKQYYYLNGVPCKIEDPTTGEQMDSVTVSTGSMKHDTAAGGFRIGGYTSVPQFTVEDMKLAYVKLYDFAADAATVTKMYENK